jgi:hypothetical protein
MQRSAYKLAPVAILLLALFPLGSGMPKIARAAGDSLTAAQVQSIAQNGYIFGYPLITMDLTRAQFTGKPSLYNKFNSFLTFPPPSDKRVVRPNADTLYSTAWLDISKEPVVLHLPDTNGQYYLMPMLDGWTDIFQSPGARTTGTKAGDYAIVPPGWSGTLPSGVNKIQAPTQIVWILGRLAASVPTYSEVNALQAQLTLTPLSKYGTSWKYSPEPSSAFGNPNAVPPPKAIAAMTPQQFFADLARLMKTNPPNAADAPMVASLASIGVVAGQPFDETKLSAAQQSAMAAGVAAARAQLTTWANQGYAISKPKNINGWIWGTDNGSYGTDYAQRAFITEIGLGANLPQDAIYPQGFTDSAGKPMSGSHNYVVHFAPGQTPPVNGFWSITMYTPDGYFVPNPISRYAIGSHTGAKPNADGSMDIYIQNASPGAAKESNWLPAPAGPFNLTLRMYWPKQAAIDGTYQMPGVTAAK